MTTWGKTVACPCLGGWELGDGDSLIVARAFAHAASVRRARGLSEALFCARVHECALSDA